MPVSTRAKRKSVDKESPPNPERLPPSPKAPRSRRSQKTPRAERPAPQPTPGAAALTRRRAQALGEEPARPQDEPERYLQQKTREQALSAQRNEGAEMERRPGSGGRDAGDGDDGPVSRNTLQGLLRRLGAGFDDGHPGSGRVKSILAALRGGDEGAALTGLTELCEYLAVATEDTMISFPIDQTVPLLVGFLNDEGSAEVAVLAARALTNLADVFPPACSYIIRHGAVPAFCARLLSIEYIDVAEQSLAALEKLSHEHPGSLLRAGALVAVLSYVDFFQTGVQRVAVATAANICRGLTPDHIDAVTTAAPILIGLLSYSDAKIVDSACMALTRIAEAFSRSPEHMETLVGFGLIASIVDMVAVNEAGSITSQLSSATFYGLIKLLATAAGGSAVVAESLLAAGVSATLRNLLVTSPLLSATAASPGNALRSADQLQDLVTLAAQLLPPVPDAAAAVLAPPSPAPAALAPGPSGSRQPSQADALTSYLRANPAVADKFATDVLAVVLHVHASSATSAVKRKARAVLTKLLYNTSVPVLSALLFDLPVSSLVARLLRNADPGVAAEGMQMAEILMEKLPDEYSRFFMKEGVVHAMEELAAAAPPPPPEIKAEPEAAPPRAGPRLPPRSGVRTRRRASSEDAAEEEDEEEREEAEAAAAAAAAARTPAGTALRSALATHAARFCARYFTDDQGNSLGCRTAGVVALEAICARLPDPAAVADLLAALAAAGESSISTFELLTSGAVRKLREYLEGADLPEAGADAEDRRWRQLERLGQFADVALPPGSGGAPPMATLVDKLQSALAATEKFEVAMTDLRAATPSFMYMGGYMGARALAGRGGEGASGSLSAGLAALSNPFKIRLSRHADAPEAAAALKDYGTNVVLIEPLASMSQVEEFLWQRVQMSPAEQARAAAGAGAGGSAGAGPSRGRGGDGEPAGGAPGTAPGSGGSGGCEPSQSRPIPAPGGGRRLTRAQARAAAEEEVAAQGSGDGSGDGDAMSEDQLMEPPAPGSADAGADAAAMFAAAASDAIASTDDEYDEDDEMDEGYVEGDQEDYDEEDDMLAAAAMHVHDMHLAEDAAAAAAAAAAAGGGGSGGGSARASPAPVASGERRAAGAAPAPAPAAAAPGGAGAGGRTYAGAAEGSAQPHLAFYLNGRLLDPGTTMFQAVRVSLAAAAAATAGPSSGPGTRSLGSRLWGDTHTLTYRPYAAAIAERDAAKAVGGASGGGAGSGDEQPMEVEAEGGVAGDPDSLLSSPLAELLAPPAAFAADGSDAALAGASVDCLDTLVVLALLEGVNRLTAHLTAALEGRRGRTVPASTPHPGHVPREAFVSGRMGPKLSQQLKDVVSICGGALPPWCDALARHARFLFPFEVRRRLFGVTAFGLPRALHHLQQAQAAEAGPGAPADRDAGSLRVARVQRQKVRLSRSRLLDSAHRVFETYAGAKSQLEVEFFGEAGSGLGPTLEFYTLLSHELQRRSLGLWRDDGADGDAAGGEKEKAAPADVLAPAPGGALARTVSGPGPLRGELLAGADDAAAATAAAGGGGAAPADLVAAPQGLFPTPLPPGPSRAEDGSAARHFRLLGRVVAKALQDGRLLDLPLSPVLYRLVLGRRVDLFSLRGVDPALATSLERLHAAERGAAAARGAAPAVVDGCPVEDLCLSFVLPGDPSYELCPGGGDVAVTSSNLRQYIDAVVDATLGAGVAPQVAAFRAGFDAIFPLASLAPFFEDEVEAMLCGTGEAWTVEGLSPVIKFDHGYTAASAPVVALLEVLTELDAVDQRRFLRFVTGTPRLPPGGVAALQPRLTVVRKLSAAGGGDGMGTSAPLGASEASAGGLAGSLAGARHPADGDLPSVMTCANYLKLPPYSSKEVLRERLLYAIREGQGSFDLS